MPLPLPKSILIVRTSSLGDIVHVLPTLRALRAAFPDARIDWVVDTRFSGILAGDPDIHQLISAPLKAWSQQSRNLAKRPHVTITLPRLDEAHLGQLFFLLLTEVLFLGKLYRIDPYGQPAVEIGKQLTKEILTHGREQ